MSAVNSSNTDPLWFLLMGFPGADDFNNINAWISLPLCSLYLLSILGNCLILFIVKLDNHLREPMYLLLSMLATTDLCLTFATLPSTISVFLFDSRRIHFFACLTQLFFIHMLCAMESSILVAMAFDRYVAICKPLQYVSILHPIISKIGLVALMRCLCLHFAVPFLLKILPYCDKHVLSFAFCYHSDVMKLACADTTITSTYNLVVVITTYPVDAIFILLSYIMILRNILNRAQQAERLKALNTCVSHLCVVMLFYIPLISLSLASRYGQKDSVLLRVVLGGILLVMPPAMNPMIYSIKTKQIRSALRKRFWPTKQYN